LKPLIWKLTKAKINANVQYDFRNVCIGGIPWGVTADQLRSLFHIFGRIEYVFLKFTPIDKLNTAFIVYDTERAAKLAVAFMKGFPVGEAYLGLNFGKPAASKTATQEQIATRPMNPNTLSFCPSNTVSISTPNSDSNIPNIGPWGDTQSFSAHPDGFQPPYPHVVHTGANNLSIFPFGQTANPYGTFYPQPQFDLTSSTNATFGTSSIGPGRCNINTPVHQRAHHISSSHLLNTRQSKLRGEGRDMVGRSRTRSPRREDESRRYRSRSRGKDRDGLFTHHSFPKRM
jgi:RNA recognition motif-containing protein